MGNSHIMQGICLTVVFSDIKSYEFFCTFASDLFTFHWFLFFFFFLRKSSSARLKSSRTEVYHLCLQLHRGSHIHPQLTPGPALRSCGSQCQHCCRGQMKDTKCGEITRSKSLPMRQKCLNSITFVTVSAGDKHLKSS